MYKKPNKILVDRYSAIFARASLSECMIGLKNECRIYSRDSYMSCITDPEVFLECVIYPRYIDGDKEIFSDFSKEIDKMINSDNPIEFFQSINYFCGERMLKKIHGELQFYIFNEKRIHAIVSRLSDMKDRMVSYREGDFGKYKETMYDLACRILRELVNV